MKCMRSLLISLTAWAPLVPLCGCKPDATAPATKPTAELHDHAAKASSSALMAQVEPAEFQAGEPVTLKLMIHRRDGSMVNDFETVHEKKVHLIIVREGLDEFAHIHPEIDQAGHMTAPFLFPVGGKYFLYADHKPADETQATAVAEVDVSGHAPTPKKLSPNVPGTVKGDDLTAEVAVDNGGAGSSSTLSFRLADEKGKPIADLEPYLGAMGHLVVISADGKEYVHAHPLASDDRTSSVVNFDAHFPAAGIYKGWGQFQRQRKVFTIPFVIKVE